MKKLFIALTTMLLSASAYGASNPSLIPNVPDRTTLTAMGVASAQYPTISVTNIGNYGWASSCPATIDGYYFVAATGTSGCWVKNHSQTIDFDLPTAIHPIRLTSVDGVNGRRLSVEAESATGSAEIQVIPGANIPSGDLASQIIFYNKTGEDYERLGITAVSNTFIFDSTAHNNGTIHNIFYQMGGYIYDDGRTGIPSQNALEVVSDASVMLNGASYTTNYNGVTQNWGVSRTTIADWTNTGRSGIIIDTRTTTPTSNTADSTFVTYRRGGASKWNVGLNTAGANTDSFDITSSGGIASASFLPAGSVFTNDGTASIVARFKTTNATGPAIRLDGVNPILDLGSCASLISGGNLVDSCLGSRGTSSVVLSPNGVKQLNVASTGVVTMPHYGAGATSFDASGNLVSASDERLKVISQKTFSPSLDTLLKIRPIEYKWNSKSGYETKHTYAGFSAQNVRAAFGSDADLVTGVGSDGYYTLQDRAILAGSLVFLQDIYKKQISDEKRISDLERQVSYLMKNRHAK